MKILKFKSKPHQNDRIVHTNMSVKVYENVPTSEIHTCIHIISRRNKIVML